MFSDLEGGNQASHSYNNDTVYNIDDKCPQDTQRIQYVDDYFREPEYATEENTPGK